MNYGYAPGDTNQEALRLDQSDEADRHCIQLYHHVAREVDLAGAAVLEVGSGRGGGCSYVARYLRPAQVCGVDFSQNAVHLCRSVHQAPNLSFQQGNAEALPCESGAFDAVINVESSHCYGSIPAFLNEVFRVLKPGGHFLWADMRAREEIADCRREFEEAGFQVLKEETITPNVLQAMQVESDAKRAKIAGSVPRFLRRAVGDFAGLEGSPAFETLRAGRAEYLHCVLKKPDGLTSQGGGGLN